MKKPWNKQKTHIMVMTVTQTLQITTLIINGPNTQKQES